MEFILQSNMKYAFLGRMQRKMMNVKFHLYCDNNMRYIITTNYFSFNQDTLPINYFTKMS